MNQFWNWVLSAVIFASASECFAESCHSKFKTGVNIDSPFFKRDSTGRSSGLAFDILEEISKRSGCQFIGSPVNFARAYEDFKYSRMDVFAITFPNPEWGRFAEHKIVYSSDRVLLLRKQGAPKEIVLSDLMKDKKIKFSGVIGAVLFFTPEEHAQLIREKRLVEAPDADSAVKLFLTGKTQVMLASPIFLNYLRQSKDFDKIAFVFDKDHPINIGIYFSKLRVPPELKKMLFATIEEMKTDGTIKKILTRYLPPNDLHRYH
ncbi:Bacterial extracellular solute-binding protein, family 3 [compost metagenome]